VTIFKKSQLLNNTQLVLNLFNSRLFAAFLICILTSCVISKNNITTEAKIIDVTSQKYKGGQKGTPSGVRYTLYIIAPANQDDFKTIGFWINDKYTPAKAYKNNVGFKKEAYSKGDTLVCSASFVLSQQGYNFEDSSQNITKPSGSNSKILLLYTIVNNKKYAEFNSIIELEEELRP